MKKINYVVVMLLVVLLGLTACSNKKNEDGPKGSNNKAVLNLREFKQFKVNISANISGTKENSNSSIKVSGSADVDIENKKGKASLNYKSNNDNINLDLIGLQDNDSIDIYYKRGEDNWKLESLDLTENIPDNVNLDELLDYNKYVKLIINYLGNNENLRKIDNDEYNYELVGNTEDVYKIIKEEINKLNIGSSELTRYIYKEFDSIKENFLIKMKVSDNYITKLSIDLTDFLNKYNIVNYDEDMTYKKAEIVLEFSDYDKDVSTQVSEDIINDVNYNEVIYNSVYLMSEAEKSFLMSNSEQEISKVIIDYNGDNPVVSYYDTNNSIINLEENYYKYDGIIPSSGVITMSNDGKITFDNVVINDYLCSMIDYRKIDCIKN